MEFLKLVRRKSFLSEVIYMTLNIALAIVIMLVVMYTGSIPLALALVIVSKWRVFAVRPRYWFVNLRANLVDFIVSSSIVIHMYTINVASIGDNNKFILLGLLTALHIVWLLFVKPQSKRFMIAIQAGVSVMLGTAALFTITYNWPVSFVVLGMWLIGYSAASHVLNAYDEEKHTLFVSLAWGVVMAEIGWVCYHWAIAYPLPFVSSLMLPQVAIIATLVSFLGYKIYDSYYHNDKIRPQDVILPIIFAVSVIAVLLIFFNYISGTV